MEVYSNAILPQETRRELNRQAIFYAKNNWRKKNNSKKKKKRKQQKERNQNIRAEISENEMKETIVKINKNEKLVL